MIGHSPGIDTVDVRGTAFSGAILRAPMIAYHVTHIANQVRRMRTMTASSSNSKSSPTTSSRAPAARWTRRSNHRRRARIGLRVHGRGGRVGRASLRRALPMTGVRLMAGRDVKTTWRVDSQMTPVAIHRGMARDSFAVVAVTPGATRSAGTHQARRPGRERPPMPRAWCGRGALRVFTRWPPPSRGRSQCMDPLAGRPSSAAGSGVSTNRSGCRVSALVGQVQRPSRRAGCSWCRGMRPGRAPRSSTMPEFPRRHRPSPVRWGATASRRARSRCRAGAGAAGALPRKRPGGGGWFSAPSAR